MPFAFRALQTRMEHIHCQNIEIPILRGNYQCLNQDF